MGSEKLCLSWNDYESNFSVAFQDLRKEEEFFDVTLACKDGQLEAHKVILSSCSIFFKDILKRNPHVHPLLYMKDVKLSQLQAVMDFMYQGKVNVEQKDLDAFLALARELKVKGLNHNEFPEEEQVKENRSVKKVEKNNRLKIRKPEDLFKPQVLSNDSNANEEHQENDGASDTTCSCLCSPCEHEVKKTGFSGLGEQADSPTAVGRDSEERDADGGRNHLVGYHVGNMCTAWNWGTCRFGQKCRFQHWCSKKLRDGSFCVEYHREMDHI